MLRNVVIIPNDILRRTMPNIFDNKKAAKVIKDLKETMIQTGAVGFAANQINEEYNICIVRLRDDRILELVNPIILRRKGKIFGPEGCLSIPNYVAVIPRAEEIAIGFRTRDGGTKMTSLSPPYSIRAQHEIDHLNGILISDYVQGINGKSGGIDATGGTIE